MAFTLPALPYDFKALEPHIDAMTMEIHHGKHHAAYVNNLNAALEPHADLQGKSLEDMLAHLKDLPEGLRTAVRNNGGGHWNHSLFWTLMSPNGGKISGPIEAEINKAFGSFDNFKAEFSKAAMGRFGSGWAWLMRTDKGLTISSTPNQDCGWSGDIEIGKGVFKPTDVLLAIDVWEHAYYLKYQNRRADYVSAFFNVINWDLVNQRLG